MSVKDFGPIGVAEVDVRPLTVLLGPSNTGKSFLAEALYAMHRSVGDAGRRRSFAYIRRARKVPRAIQSAVAKWADSASSAGGEDHEILSWPTEDVKNYVEEAVKKRIRDDVREEVARCFGAEDAADLGRRGGGEPSLGINTQGLGFEVGMSSNETKLTLAQLTEGLSRRLLRNCVHEATFRWEDDDEEPVWELDSGVLTHEICWAVLQMLGPHGRVYYLLADRTGVMDSHRVIVSSVLQNVSRVGVRETPAVPMLTGVMVDFIDTLVTRISRLESRGSRRRRSKLANGVEKLLDGSIRVDVGATGYPTFAYRPGGWKEDLPLGQASSMVSELSPIVLYLRHVISPGDLVIIEEPEAHLHPAKQADLAVELGRLVLAGVRIVLTTHSEWLLEKIANLVQRSALPEDRREGDVSLAPEQVGAWLFQPGQEGSTVEELEIDEETGLYPAEYDKVSEALYNESARIFNARQGGDG